MAQDINKVFRYGGFEARFDASDFRQMERAEAAVMGLDGLDERVAEVDGMIEKLKTMFYAFAGVLDKAFDNENAANLALGGTASLDDAVDAVFAFVAFVQAQDAAIAERWTKLTSKYAPKR
jgi:hypothetical protein